MPSRKPSPSKSGPVSLDDFLADLEHPHKAAIEQLRALILGLDGRIGEEVKWNAPSFKIDEHFATFKLYPPKRIQLVLHTGAKGKSGTRVFEVDDPDGLLTWPATDRCVLTLESSDELERRQAAVAAIVRQWIAQL